MRGSPRGCWIVLTYREHAVARPLRPLVRIVRDSGAHEDVLLPGAALGRATWLGCLPADCAGVHLAVDPRTDFVLERVGIRSHANVLAECLVKRPLKVWVALYHAVRRDERRFRDGLRGACAVTRRGWYGAWAGTRRSIASGCGPEGPAIRLLIPAHRTDTAAVAATLRSLDAQTAPRWHATVAWADGSPESSADPRITHVAWPAGGTLGDLIADSEVFGILAPGESLRPDALALLATALAASDAPGMVYADEEVAGPHPIPRLKPDWSPDLALATGYPGFALHTGPLLAPLRALPLSAPQDCRTDLGLRIAAQVDSSQVIHLPRVLLSAPPDARAARHAERLERHLRDTGSAVGVQVCPEGADLLWPLPQPAPLVSIVMPSRDRLDLVRTATHGVLNGTAYPAIELVVFDNGSTDPAVLAYYEDLRRDPRVTILSWPAPFDFSAMTNAGIAAARGRVVVLLNNDIAVLRADWLDALVRQACRPEVGAVGAKLLYADGTLQHAGVVVGLGGRAGHILRRRPAASPGHLGQMRVAHEVSAVTAACLAVEKHKLVAVGGLDAEKFPIDFNDVDLCLRLNAAGYKTVWTPHAVLAHLESTSRGPARGAARVRFESEASRFVTRWRDNIRYDPFYHPALSLTTFGEDLE